MEIGKMRLQRNLLIIVSALLLTADTILAVQVRTQNKLVVLVPTLDKEVVIGTNYVSEDYLLLRAEQVLGLLFNVREDNYQYNLTQLLAQVDSSSHEEFKTQLDNFISDVKQKKYYYVFHKQSTETDSQNLTVTFTGFLETYLIDKKIAEQPKIFRFSFVNNGGMVMLTSFEELEQEREREQEQELEVKNENAHN